MYLVQVLVIVLSRTVRISEHDMMYVCFFKTKRAYNIQLFIQLKKQKQNSPQRPHGDDDDDENRLDRYK